MKFVLDTSAYSAFNRGDVRLRPWFSADREIITPLVVLGELRAGFATGNRRDENERLLQRFLDTPTVTTVTITDTTTRLFAATYLGLRQAGKPIGTNDIWIAALALEHDAPLLTLDADFSNITRLSLVKI